ncbi:MAG TPA: hypothetical protein VJ858_03605 [Acidimicrobiia bacterium]|nr:hypothetical protein [Acidimicrobiia bacterium]
MPYPSITTDQYERLRDEIRGLRDEIRMERQRIDLIMDLALMAPMFLVPVMILVIIVLSR